MHEDGRERDAARESTRILLLSFGKAKECEGGRKRDRDKMNERECVYEGEYMVVKTRVMSDLYRSFSAKEP